MSSTSLGLLEAIPVQGGNIVSINLGTPNPPFGGVLTLGSLTALKSFTANDYLITQANGIDKLVRLEYLSLTGLPFLSADIKTFDLNTKPYLKVFNTNNTNLTGTLPSLSGLASLEVMSCNYNSFYGSVPSLSATALRSLSLRNNQLIDFTNSRIPNTLTSIDLSNNFLSITALANCFAAATASNATGNIVLTGVSMPVLKTRPPYTTVQQTALTLFNTLTARGWNINVPTTAPLYVPDPPSNINVTSKDSALAISWSKPFTGNSPITNYKVYLKSYVDSASAVVSPNSTSTIIGGLTNKELYTIYITADNAIGTSLNSNNAYGVPLTDIATADNNELALATVLTPQMYGAVGDGKTNDTAAIQRMLSATVPNNYVAYNFGTSTYFVSGKNLDYLAGVGPSVLTYNIYKVNNYRKIWFIGNNAKLTTTSRVGPPGPTALQPNSILGIYLTGGSIIFDGLTFERTEQATLADGDSALYAGQAVRIANGNPNVVTDHIYFRNCTFINANRAPEIVGYYYQPLTTTDLERPYYVDGGSIGYLKMENCNWLYPYGANVSNTAGGGTGTYIGPVVYLAHYTSCKFDGATTGDVRSVPNKVPKDGWHMGEPQRLLIDGNTEVKHAWVEGIAQGPAVGIQFVSNSFIMPPPTTVDPYASTIIDCGQASSLTRLKPGMRIWYEMPGGNNYDPAGVSTGPIYVKEVISDSKIRVQNPGETLNAPTSAFILSGGFLTFDRPFPQFWTYITNVSFPLSGVIVDDTSKMWWPDPSIRTNYQRTIVTKCTGYLPMLLVGGNESNLDQYNYNNEIADCVYLKPAGTQIRNGYVMWPMFSNMNGTIFRRNTHIAPIATGYMGTSLLGYRSGVEGDTYIANVRTPTGHGDDGFQYSCGVFINNYGTAISQSDAPYVKGCTFKNLNKGITTNPNQTNRVTIYNDNIYINVPQPFTVGNIPNTVYGSPYLY